ncbi:MAG TPA: hypothetical protein VFC67_17490 [Prolixibacteraceae bacterium]|nr:hypothetical protein [Prolixibacteraceae bacterium]
MKSTKYPIDGTRQNHLPACRLPIILKFVPLAILNTSSNMNY